jgi:hypothetical protein
MEAPKQDIGSMFSHGVRFATRYFSSVLPGSNPDQAISRISTHRHPDLVLATGRTDVIVAARLVAGSGYRLAGTGLHVKQRIRLGRITSSNAFLTRNVFPTHPLMFIDHTTIYSDLHPPLRRQQDLTASLQLRVRYCTAPQTTFAPCSASWVASPPITGTVSSTRRSTPWGTPRSSAWTA